MTTTRFTLLAATVLVAALAACSTPAAVDPTSTTADQSSTASVSTTNEIATTTRSESTTDAPATSDLPTTQESPTAEVSTSPVDGFGLAGQDLLNAGAAWDAYGRYQEFYRQAQADPGADWSAQLASLTADPLIVNAQSSLTTQARLGQKIDNQLRVELTGIQTFSNYVLFNGCFDNTATTAQDKDGNDVKAPNAPGSYYRTPGEIEVDLINGVWIVVDIQFPDRNISC